MVAGTVLVADSVSLLCFAPPSESASPMSGTSRFAILCHVKEEEETASLNAEEKSSSDFLQSIPNLLQHVASGRFGIDDLVFELSLKQRLGSVVFVPVASGLKPMPVSQSS